MGTVTRIYRKNECQVVHCVKCLSEEFSIVKMPTEDPALYCVKCRKELTNFTVKKIDEGPTNI